MTGKFQKTQMNKKQKKVQKARNRNNNCHIYDTYCMQEKSLTKKDIL